MNAIRVFVSFILMWLSFSILSAQQTDFPVGVFTFGEPNLNYVEIHDNLHVTWIQGVSGTPLDAVTNMKIIPLQGRIPALRGRARTIIPPFVLRVSAKLARIPQIGTQRTNRAESISFTLSSLIRTAGSRTAR